MPSVVCYCNAECRYAERRNAECRPAECPGANVIKPFTIVIY
jgi:hypothetical protein